MAKDGSITHLLVIFLGITLISSSVTAFSSPVLAAAPGTFIDDFVSSGSGGLDIPKNLAFGPDGNLYVISFAHDKVKRYDGSTGAYIDIFVASGSGGLDGPQGLEFGPDGNLYITSEYTNQVLRYDGSTGAFIDVFVSGGLSNPQESIFGPDGNLYVSNYFGDDVVRFDGSTGALIDVFVPAGSGGLNTAQGLEFGPDGNLYVASENTDEVLRYDGTTGSFIDAFTDNMLHKAKDLAFGPDGNLYGINNQHSHVERYDGATGVKIDRYVSGGTGGLSSPQGLVFGPDDRLYVTSQTTDEILRFEGPFGVDIPSDITSPADGQSFEEGTTITFTGTADDTEDLEWVSDIDGLIGTGSPVSTSSLSVGTHIITMTDTDEGDSSSISVNITPMFNCDGHLATIVGTSGDDVIDGTSGDDVIMGLEGDDVINGNGGNDIVCSGNGNDIVTTGSGNDEIHGEGGFDTFDAGDGVNLIDADFGIEGDTVTTGSGDDTILLGDGDDIVNAGDGKNSIETGSGDDSITSGSGDDDIFGGSGNDTIDAGGGNNHVHGDSGHDVITTGSGNDDIDGNNGDDVINSGNGNDQVYGGNGNDTIDSADGNNYVEGNKGDDKITTGPGTDTIFGGNGNDCINSGGEAGDSIDGGSGTNLINTGSCDFPATEAVKPILECVEDLGSGNYRAHFGYKNLNSVPVSIPIGSSNKFTPSPQDQGQPTSFDVGRTSYYPDAKFSIDFDGSALVWTLKGPDGNTRTSTASSSGPACPIVTPPTLTITNPTDGFISTIGNSITFSAEAKDSDGNTISYSIKWTSDLDDEIGNGDSFSIFSLKEGVHTITATVTDSDSISTSVSIVVNVGAIVEEKATTLICHFPPGNPGKYHEMMIKPSELFEHKSNGDKLGECEDDEGERLKLIKIKKHREEIRDKNELKEKRETIKEIRNNFKEIKNLDVKDKEELKELVEDIKEVLEKLKENPEFVKEHKRILKSELKETKSEIEQNMSPEEKITKHKVESKIHTLSKSDDPKFDAKKLGLDYKNGKTTIAIKLLNDNQKVIQEIGSVATIDAKNNDHVQVKVKLQDLPKLRAIDGIKNIRAPFNAVQYYEDLSEGVYFMNADLAQFKGITGKGVKVAVLDLSFTNNPKISDNIVEVKSFRAGVDVLPIQWHGDEALHGTAVAEIITDVAPNAELYLYSMETDVEFANAVDWAISKKLDVIVMSAGWPNFPTDGTSHITKKIEEAVDNGIVFVVPAGNFANKHWEGSFLDSNFNNWHDYSDSDEGLSISVDEQRIEDEIPIITHLMWDVKNADVADFELVLVDPLGQIVAFSANEQLTKSDTPFEYIHHIPEIEGIYSIGVLFAGDMSKVSERPSAILELFSINDELEHPVTQSSVSVPADADGAIVVGAINHLDGVLEPFSSQGPTNHGKLAPHVVGPDGVTTLALDGKPFFGTSATTPYVAGLAALILETDPDISPKELLTKIQQNTGSSLFSLQDEYDYSLGYGPANAFFLIEEKEVLG